MSRSTNPASSSLSTPPWPRLGLCAALLQCTACGQKPDDPNGDSALAEPDLGPDAVVCGEPDYPAGTDADIAALAGCDVFEGYVKFTSLVTDPSPLRSLRVIRGGVGAGGYNRHVETLEGLENLEWSGKFTFLADGLHDISAVANLEKVGGTFGLDEMPNLTDLHGLENLRIIGGNASIRANPSLTSLDGLAGLERVIGNLRITHNPQLPRDQVDALLARIQVDGEVVVD